MSCSLGRPKANREEHVSAVFAIRCCVEDGGSERGSAEVKKTIHEAYRNAFGEIVFFREIKKVSSLKPKTMV
jgi:hypothetical protein